GGVWISLSDLARQRNISRSSVKERVDRLEAEGLVSTRRSGKLRLVELAAFDRATGSVSDFGKELAASVAKEVHLPVSGAYRDAQTKRAQYEAQLKALDLAERQGQLLPIKGAHGVEAAVTKIGLAIAHDLDTLALYAEEVATAVSKEGVTGARRVLKEAGAKVRRQIADSLIRIASRGLEAERVGPIETDLSDDDRDIPVEGLPIPAETSDRNKGKSYV
ncbi:winged helix-turn-helix transcriptional regulator, partial [Rhizobiaceae sp. 2RAB30]